MNHDKKLDAAIAEKEKYLDWLEHKEYKLERALERSVKLEMSNRFFIGVGKFFIISSCFTLFTLQMYGMFKYVGPYLFPALF